MRTPWTVARARRTVTMNRRAQCPRYDAPRYVTKAAETAFEPTAPLMRTRSSRGRAGVPARPLLPLDPGRYGMRLKMKRAFMVVP